jgi:glycine oxidase
VAAAERAGVTFDRRQAAEVAVTDDRVRGVTLIDRTVLPADAVVLAAGTGTPLIGGIPDGVVPPVRPVKGQLLHLRGAPQACPRAGVVRGLDVYIVSRGDGRVVVGATMEERGVDTTVTAGAVLQLLQAAWELVPGIAELELVETAVGLRPATPDNAPVLGASAVEGLHLATGHFRNGILLAPITADTVAAGLAGESADLIRPFAAQRFFPAGVAT